MGSWEIIRRWRRPRIGSGSLLRYVLLTLTVSLTACTTEIYHTRADEEAYSILFNKANAVGNVSDADLSLGELEPLRLDGLSRSGGGSSFLGSAATSERGAKVICLADALETGVKHSREYLSEKEAVYLSALDLTLARHRLSPLFFAGGDVGLATDNLSSAVNNLVTENTFARTSEAGFTWLTRTGARITTDFTRDFLRFTTGNRSVNESDVVVSIVQPLLQGAGSRVTLEALTQAERNVLYSLRDFADFRRFFVVDVVSDYYGVLQARDRVKNNYLAYRGFLETVEREEALAEEDRRTQTQLGLLRQAALQSESQWIDSIRRYETLLDDFKLSLGVPVAESIVLDDRELSSLRIIHPKITRDQAVQVALVSRHDLATAADLVDDAARQAKVAENGLKPGLDLSVDYVTTSDPGDNTPGINWDRHRWDAEVDLDLPLDRKEERNFYRSALISEDRAKRFLEQARDEARLEIYDAWRALEQAERNFAIAEQGVALATRRLEEQRLLAELGNGEARDLIDAQNDLVSAQNDRTSTVVVHVLARLRLWRDMGILYIQEDGSWAKALAKEPPYPEKDS